MSAAAAPGGRFGPPAARSLRHRILTSFAMAAVALGVGFGLSAWWIERAMGGVRDHLSSDRHFESRVSGFQGAVLRELEAGRRYLATGDPRHELEFRNGGFEAFRLQEELMAHSAASPDVAVVIAPLQRHLAISEAALARAHRLAELGRMTEAMASLEATDDRTDSILAGLERLDGLKSARREAAAARVALEVRRGGTVMVLILAGGLAITFLTAVGTVRVVVSSTRALVSHADRLRAGDLSARTEVAPLPVEFRTLGGALNDASGSLARLAEQERALRQSEKLSTVGLLVSGVAHELNNPLAGILVSADDLLEANTDPAMRAGLGAIRIEATRAREVVRKLLATVRGEAAAQGSARLADVESRARERLEARARNRGVTLEWTLPEGDIEVVGEGPGLETLVENLVSNAIDFTPPGRRVTVQSTLDDEAASLIVEDEGPGIGPEIRSRIFDPFFTTRRAGDGVGLGLSVVAGIVRSAGGSIEHANRPADEGGGSRFVVTLPLGSRSPPVPAGEVLEPAREPGRSEARASAGPAPVGDGPGPPRGSGSARVLLVDDEVAIRRALRRIFERRGWQVEEAVDGAEALDRIRATALDPFDVVLCDLKMPVMTGMQLVDRLALENPEQRSRFVIITGDNVAAGPADFVARTDLPVVDKPFRIDELLATVDGVLERIHV